MTASKFKVGDSVKIYGGCRQLAKPGSIDFTGDTGVIKDIGPNGNLAIEFRNHTFFAHPKQCRRLIKKPRRRVWIPRADINSGDKSRTSWRQMPDWIEFIEVKKRGRE